MIAGDVLFIPALWFHNVVAHDYSVAVNVFWRHLPKEMFEEKDTYGNRDPIPAARAMMSIASALKALQSLPAGRLLRDRFHTNQHSTRARHGHSDIGHRDDHFCSCARVLVQL